MRTVMVGHPLNTSSVVWSVVSALVWKYLGGATLCCSESEYCTGYRR